MRSHFVSALRVVFFITSSSIVGGLVACGASGSDASLTPDANLGGDADAGSVNPAPQDAGVDRQTIKDFAPSLVLVNGLIGGGTRTYDDVRVCIDGVTNPLPDAVPMPMTNYPGVARGNGVDLGQVSQTTLTLKVFHAGDLSKDAAWATSRVACDSWVVGTPFTSIAVSLLTGGPTLAVLVDDANGPDGIQVRTGLLPGEYVGTKDSLQLVTAEFSTFAKKGESLQVTLEQAAAGSGTTGVLSTSVFAFTPGGPVAGAKLRFERRDAKNTLTAFFEQTLGSVQFLSDPTTTPSTYFDRRTNFALVLLGDETKPVALDEKDLHFDGRGLHVVAVPYAAGAP